jgi:hypothetical protein
MVGAVYQFKDFYIDFYDKNIEDDRYDTIIYKGTSPTIIITHSFLSDDEEPTTIKLYYYVKNKNGSITLKNIYDAINEQTDQYLKIYDTTKVRRLYIEDFIPVNPITFELLTFAYDDAIGTTIKYVNSWSEMINDNYWVVADENGDFNF